MTRWRSAVAYTAAWLPLFAVYALAVSSTRAAPVTVLLAAVYDTLPPALLVVAVIRLCRRWEWPEPGRRVRFLLHHGAAAVVYAGLGTAGTLSLFLLHGLATAGSPEFDRVDLLLLLWLSFINLVVFLALAGGAHAFDLHGRLRQEEARAARAEALRRRTELEALHARLDPHFLFNTIHSLLALVRHDAEAAEAALERFGSLLRYPVRLHQENLEEVELAEEWAFYLDYLDLEAMRLGPRLRVETDLAPGAAGCLVPALTLQPLVENAVRHGVAPRRSGGRLRVWAAVDDGFLELGVADDGPGATARDMETRRGQGLRLVRRRLGALYGGAACVEARRPPDGGFEIRLALPARCGEA